MTDVSKSNRKLGFSTRAIHLGYDPADANGALNPPIYMTSTYAFETAEAGQELFRGDRPGYIYGRTRNPTQAILEERIASLEGAEAAIAVASGMAGISSIMLSLLDAGDQVVVDTTLYGNTFAYFTQALPRWGIEVRLADFTDPEMLEATIGERTKLVFFETPANPNLRVIDIGRVAQIAHAAGALVVVDNTFATPALQRPLSLGADLVAHSATKYIGGHGDVLAGLVAGSADIVNRIRGTGLRYITGATLSPMNCFLLLRGLKTLELRMERHSSSALALAQLLEAHGRVASVSYPGLESFAGHAVARRQMSAFGGLISFELDGSAEQAMAMMNKLALVTRAVSLGDCETLIQHPATMTHAVYPPEERRRHGISDGLLRLSVGLETIDDVLEDVQQALDLL